MDAADRAWESALPLHLCFRVAGRLAFSGTLDVRLRDRDASALAALLPMLGCGEEAATLAFDGLAEAASDPAAKPALLRIARDERVHDALLTQLRKALPAPVAARASIAASRRFHVRLGVGGTAAHLARIAALDSAVCTILSRLIRRGTPVAGDQAVAAIFRRIRDDEARHVALSRQLALADPDAAMLRDLAAATRVALSNIIALEAGSFEILGVDPDALDRTLRHLPNGLLSE